MPGGANKTGYAIFVIRVVTGVIFVAHGAQDLFGVFDGAGVSGMISHMDKLNLVPSSVLGWTYCMVQFFGGLFLVFGIFPRIISFLQAVFILLFMWKVHIRSGFFVSHNYSAAEFPLILLACCICIMLTGAGAFSSYDKY
jgi:putative oxidoreductase